MDDDFVDQLDMLPDLEEEDGPVPQSVLMVQVMKGQGKNLIHSCVDCLIFSDIVPAFGSRVGPNSDFAPLFLRYNRRFYFPDDFFRLDLALRACG
ncbi:MAG: hypothetical protein R6U40_00115 [Desulfobacterales bacterium]